MRFLFVVHKNEEKAEQNSVLFHRLTLKERGLRPNGYFPLMRQPLFPNVGYRLQARDQAAKSGKVVYLRCLPLLADNEQLSLTRLIQ